MKKRWMVLIGGILSILIVAASSYYFYQKREGEKYLKRISCIIVEPGEYYFQVIEGTKAVVAKRSTNETARLGNTRQGSKFLEYTYDQRDPMATSEYLAYEESSKKINHYVADGPTLDVEKSLLHVYKIATTELVKEKVIDIKKVLYNYNKYYAPYQVDGLLMIDGKSYVNVNFYNKFDDRFSQKKIYIGIENEEVLESLADKDLSQNRGYDADSNLLYQDVTNLQEHFQISDPITSNYCWFDEESDLSATGLVKEHAELNELLTAKKNEKIFLFFPDISLSSETIAKWLTPEGTDIYQNLNLHGAYSKDAQEHEIHSLTEFREWYQPQQENTTEWFRQ